MCVYYTPQHPTFQEVKTIYMKKKMIFSGTATALITPFKHGKIDYDALRKIIEWQIQSGLDALVIGGTTGEAATLSDYERDKLYSFSAETVNRRVPLIFGTGSNDTKRAVRYTKRAKELGADAALSVTPYYNKGTEGGLLLHYQKIANSTDLPTILYNVPSRTGVNLSISNIEKLCAEENIVAIKEASDSLDRLLELSKLAKELTLYSGNDTQIYATLSLGGMGVISVLSNVCPCEVLDITNAFWRGDAETSIALQRKISHKAHALFLETNPSPIKHAMSLLGYCSDEVRLPLYKPSKSTRQAIEKAFAATGNDDYVTQKTQASPEG